MNSTSRTLLIIDDSPEDRALYRRYLLLDQDYSYTILEASLGQQGLELWHQHQPDAVLVDYRLPDLDGLEFLAQLQSSRPQSLLPVIMMTGQGNEAIAVQAMKVGAQDYLVKEQITPEGLCQAVNGALETVQLRTQLRQCTERERLVAQVTQKIHQSLDLEEILQTAVTEVRQFLQTDRVLIFRLQTDSWGTVTTESVGSEWLPLLSTSLRDTCFNENYAESFRQGSVTVKPNIHDGSLDPCHRDLLASLQVQANLVVPILQDHQLWGMLIAHHCAAPRQWQPLEIDLLQELATQVGIALQQAELYQQVCRELAERKRAEAALQESQQFVQKIADTMPGMLYVYDLVEQRNIYSNRYSLELLGYTPEQLEEMGTDITPSIVHPDDLPSAMAYQAQFNTVLPGEVLEIEYRVRQANDEWCWLLSRSMVFSTTPAGNTQQILGVSINITDRKRAEEALNQSQLLVQRQLMEIEAIYQTAPIGMAVLDQELRFVRLNQRLAEINGIAIDDHIGRTIYEIVPDLVEEVELPLQNVIATGTPLRNQEINGETKSQPGVCRTWIENCYPLRDETGLITGINVVVQEITDRKRSEKALQASEEQSRNILESITDAFFALDREWRYTYLNPQVERLVNRSPSDLLGKIIWEEYPELIGSEFETAYYRAANEQIASSITAFYPDHDRWYELRVYPAVAGVTAYLRDVTDLKRIEVEREQLLEREKAAREAAETANRIKDEFLATLSHELRAPLNPILGWSQLLQVRKFDQAKLAEAHAIIERSVKLQVQLIDNLLDIAKILHGKLTIKAVRVDLVFVIKSALDTVKAAASAKSIHIQKELPQICQVAGDSARLQQVVWNLLSNAVKFTPHHGQVQIHLEQVGNQAQITVSDTGKGIDPHFLPYIFESFRQEDATTTRKHGGLGLGLAIVRTLVEAHGGTICAKSQGEAKGATFTVHLPLSKTDIESEQPELLEKQEPQLAGVRVLVVDDDVLNHELITVALSHYGVEVTCVASAADALNYLDSFTPDVLVSDIGMPDMDGYIFMQTLRSLPPEKGGQIPAIALTSYARQQDIQRAIKSGFHGHVSKPINIDQFVQAVEALARTD
jgi:PAS domain S-box-containing protein